MTTVIQFLVMLFTYTQPIHALDRGEYVVTKFNEFKSYSAIHKQANKYLNKKDLEWLNKNITSKQLSKIKFKPHLSLRGNKFVLEWALSRLVFIEVTNYKKGLVKINGREMDFTKLSLKQLSNYFSKLQGTAFRLPELLPKAYANPLFAYLLPEVIPILIGFASSVVATLAFEQNNINYVKEQRDRCFEIKKNLSSQSPSREKVRKIEQEVYSMKEERESSTKLKVFKWSHGECKNRKPATFCKDYDEFESCFKFLIEQVEKLPSSSKAQKTIQAK